MLGKKINKESLTRDFYVAQYKAGHAAEPNSPEFDILAGEYARERTQAAGVDYAETAVWCNANNATMVDQGDYYAVAPIPAPAIAALIRLAEAEKAAHAAALIAEERDADMLDDAGRKAAAKAEYRALTEVYGEKIGLLSSYGSADEIGAVREDVF